MGPDLVVIGAGALGLSTALHAALLGQSVLVLDRHAAGSQASGRAAGLFKSVQADELRTRLARRSIERALSFAEWAGAELDVRRSGSFLIGRTSEHRNCSAGRRSSPAAGAQTCATPARPSCASGCRTTSRAAVSWRCGARRTCTSRSR